MCAKLLKSYLILCNLMDCSPPASSVHEIFPGKNTGVDCHFLLQGIFLTQGSNPCLMSSSLAGRFFTSSATWEAAYGCYCTCGRPGFDPWVGKIPWRRESYPLHYSGLENSMDCIVHGVTKNWTRLSDFHFLF